MTVRTHGTYTGFPNGCRCDPCRWAWASYQRGERPPEPIPRWLDQWARTAGRL